MAHWQIETKKQLVEFLPFDGRGFIQVTLYNKDREMFANLTKVEVLYIPLTEDNVKKLQSYKSISALVKFAKANQIQQPQAATLCPAPASTPAKSLEQEQGILFLEVESVGRGNEMEVVELAVVDIDEQVLFHTLVKPSKPIKDTKAHGIQNADVINAPRFDEIWQDFSSVIGNSVIAFYNAQHDSRIIKQSLAKAFDSPVPKHFYTLFPHNKVVCVGDNYEAYRSNDTGFRRNYYPSMINQACGQEGIVWRDVPKHRAIGDAKKSARLYKFLQDKEDS